MIEKIISHEQHAFEWIDIVDPQLEDFKDIKVKYDLHDESIQDCIEIGHLPKIEKFPSYHFLIIRSMAENFEDESDTLTEITDRISIFYNENFIITVHRNSIPFLEKLKNKLIDNYKFKSARILINALVSEALKSFENLALQDLSGKLDEYEEIVFLHQKRKPFLKKLYYIKRQIDVIKSVLVLYKDIVDYFHLPEYRNIYTQNLRDMFARVNTLYRNLAENTGQLLSIYFNIESNHTNEIMRTLTIISVFFMPLTFIVGIYGMNFTHMPELDWRYSYPTVLIFMLVLSALIYFWFKRKRWL